MDNVFSPQQKILQYKSRSYCFKTSKNQAMLTLVDKVPTKVGSMQQKEKI